MSMKRTKMLYIPIEPLDERYTEQWYRNFPKLFEDKGFDVTVIDGVALSDTVDVGTFLDINSTTHYKWSQLQKLSILFRSKQIEEGTHIFFGDIEFWGIESVRLLSDMNGVKTILSGFLHAGSYTIEDAFSIASPYQKYTEVGWVASLDYVFVGSQYHKDAFVERRLVPLLKDPSELANKIHVTGNPVFLDEYPTFEDTPKTRTVVLSNRFDSEKRPGETLELFSKIKRNPKYSDWNFVICTGRKSLDNSNVPELVKKARELCDEGILSIEEGLTKLEYHELLASASVMVSHSKEENFGYCVIEAMVYGCIPLLRKGLSHTELVKGNEKYLFTDVNDSEKKLKAILDTVNNKKEEPENTFSDTCSYYAESLKRVCGVLLYNEKYT